ncbi:thiosulfate oxidation carrier protein SoxY [Sulfuriferula plumbiphila]|uniref:Thiosulfate oxidation carrier protein SoxY n=1 Tax=Sulfuriferula plumbiphila TaxID=171865 RepID=A0A512L3V8_9PROT|nr:thiosulfate oxidation carrier protein SoxY [Sulfuriferula plumbiphila]BBP05553.1 thiosulfate oxidation carrier protein SoxY [Sulfuriferula plumbiphila]GEP29150.1 thiosulfate oxidation carrier protein SoxY [Sulfuriferula plumbiphila]
MNALRRNILKSAGATGIVAMAAAAGLLKSGNVLAAWNSSAFAAKTVPEAIKDLGLSTPADSKAISIKAPDIAENGAVVPVEVTSSIAGTTGIAIFAEKNATPLITDFKLSNGAEGFISTRIKMGQTAMVRAVVTAGGKTYTAAKEVKVTIGGCGG